MSINSNSCERWHQLTSFVQRTILSQAFFPSMKPLGMMFGVRISYLCLNSWKTILLGNPCLQILIPSSTPLHLNWSKIKWESIFPACLLETWMIMWGSLILQNVSNYLQWWSTTNFFKSVTSSISEYFSPLHNTAHHLYITIITIT